MHLKNNILALLLVPSLFAVAAAQSEESPVQIGVVQPLTGQAGPSGQTVLRGINLAAEEINKSGGILGGRPIKVVAEDGKCIPSESVSAAKKLIHQDSVSVLIGALCSSATLAIQDITGETKTVHIAAAPISPKLTDPNQRHKYFFRVTHNSAEFAKGFAAFIHEEIKPKTMAYLAVNDDYGRSEVGQLQENLARLGSVETVFEGFFEYRDKDFTSVLARIRSASPDGLYIVARLPQNVSVVKQMKSIGYRPGFVAGDVSFSQQKFIEDAGEAGEGIYFPTLYFPDDAEPGARRFQEAYKSKFGAVPLDVTASLGWTALYVAALGMDQAGEGASPEDIAAAIQKLKWEGPYGTLEFDENGQNMVDVRIGQVVNGKPVEVR